jgi:hypothetical protein
MATSEAGVVADVDAAPHPAAAAVTQLPASTAKDILIACRMPFGRSRDRHGSAIVREV